MNQITIGCSVSLPSTVLISLRLRKVKQKLLSMTDCIKASGGWHGYESPEDRSRCPCGRSVEIGEFVHITDVKVAVDLLQDRQVRGY